MPTKAEQSAALAMFGRGHGERGACADIAPQSPSDCFDAALPEAGGSPTKKYRTPVFILSDAYTRHARRPGCCLSRVNATIDPGFGGTKTTRSRRQSGRVLGPTSATRTRWPPWALPGPLDRHRIGGMRRRTGHGKHRLRPSNHGTMVRLRSEVDGIARDIPPLEVEDPTAAGVLVIAGADYGPIGAAARLVRDEGRGSRRRTFATSNRCPPTPPRCLSAYTAGL